MKIAILLDSNDAKDWATRLASALCLRDHQVWILPIEAAVAQSLALRFIGFFERKLYQRPPSTPTPFFSNEAPQPQHFDVVIAGRDGVCNHAALPSATHIWHLRYSGFTGHEAAAYALTQNSELDIGLYEGDERLATAYPAREDPRSLTGALAHVYARAITLLIKTVTLEAPRLEANAKSLATSTEKSASHSYGIRKSTPGKNAALLAFFASGFARKLWGRLTKASMKMPHWAIVFKKPEAAWQLFTGVEGQLYADPFPLIHEGKLHLFFESFSTEQTRGVIASSFMQEDGRFSKPQTVLTRPYHISYPLVFVDGTEIYMLPETSEAKTLELYRAEEFPQKWVQDTILMKNIALADASLIKTAGLYWIFATSEEDGGSSWDCLNLYYSTALRGPYLPHKLNPVIIDKASARPAGALFLREGRLFRPVQDCTKGYGMAMKLMEITMLTPDSFQETFVENIELPQEFSPLGGHSFNCAGDYHFCDIMLPK